jgi:hypothetical protein
MIAALKLAWGVAKFGWKMYRWLRAEKKQG